YNRPATGTHPAHARTTLDLVREFRTTAGALTGTWNTTWASTWSINNLNDAAVVNQAGAVFPYPYPQGTIQPAAGDWPLTDTVTITQQDVYVYYEKYADGTAGVFVRRLTDSGNGYTEIDLLNPYGTIVEAGYASRLGTSGSVNSRRDYRVGLYNPTNNDWSGNWRTIGAINEHYTPTPVHPDYPYLLPISLYWFEQNLMTDAGFASNPHLPIIVGITLGQGNNAEIAGVVMFNPLFAKSVYPVFMDGTVLCNNLTESNLTIPNVDTIRTQTTFYIHTPWQMQQISRLTEATGVNLNRTEGLTFVQGNDISFGSATLSASMQLLGLGKDTTQRTAGTVIPYTATTPQNNGTTAVFPTTNSALYPVTGHVVRGEFLGTFDGGGRTISDLTLPNSAALPRSLFASIGSETAPSNATVRNISINNFDLSGSANISAIAALNYKSITDISITKSKLTGAPDGYVGGVAGRNFGEILRVDVTETVIENTGTGTGVSYVGGIAGENTATGKIGSAAILQSTVRAENAGESDMIGSIAGSNAGTIEDVMFISDAEESPVYSLQSDRNGIIGGITAHNEGVIARVLYLARAVRDSVSIKPIVNTMGDGGTLNHAYYLTGTHIPGDSPRGEADGLFAAAHGLLGTGLTTHEMNALRTFADSVWKAAEVSPTSNTILNAEQYPYQYFGESPPAVSPRVTVPAIRLAYYEIYDDESMGFSPGTGLPDLQDKEPKENGYAAIVPTTGGYSIKAGAAGNNTHLLSSVYEYGDGIQVHYVRLPAFSLGTSRTVEIFVNDLHPQEGGRYINPNFAPSADAIYDIPNPTIFNIRTPQQMRNISNFASTQGLTFNLLRDLDFADVNLGTNSAVVTGTFNGTFNGNGHTISNVSITPQAAAADAGLFAAVGSSGTIKDLVLESGDDSAWISVTSSSANINAGAVAGTNSGTIENITLNFTVPTVPGGAKINVNSTGIVSAGGIAGINNGTVQNIALDLGETAFIYQSGSIADPDQGGAGGIAGVNTGKIQYVSIVSTGDVSPIKGNHNAAGIAGVNNGGIILENLYLARAPQVVTQEIGEDDKTLIFPVVYKWTDDIEGAPEEDIKGEIKDNYYLSGEASIKGDPEILDDIEDYNVPTDYTAVKYGTPIATDNMTAIDEWTNEEEEKETNWLPADTDDPDDPDGYPYPRPTEHTPKSWPETEEPAGGFPGLSRSRASLSLEMLTDDLLGQQDENTVEGENGGGNENGDGGDERTVEGENSSGGRGRSASGATVFNGVENGDENSNGEGDDPTGEGDLTGGGVQGDDENDNSGEGENSTGTDGEGDDLTGGGVNGDEENEGDLIGGGVNGDENEGDLTGGGVQGDDSNSEEGGGLGDTGGDPTGGGVSDDDSDSEGDLTGGENSTGTGTGADFTEFEESGMPSGAAFTAFLGGIIITTGREERARRTARRRGGKHLCHSLKKTNRTKRRIVIFSARTNRKTLI
ncbi:MAG: hypothetical protein FWH17_06815, partial [Oscillospiraceae bacterium]|nr:hypothetical protein [Oscillospiraceae bacterium]